MQLVGHHIDSPIYRLDNFDESFLFFDQEDTEVDGTPSHPNIPSEILQTAGWEPSLSIFGAFTGTIVVKTSPDGKNFIPVLTITAPGLFGRNDLKFPAFAMQLELTALTLGGVVSAEFYSERRHR